MKPPVCLEPPPDSVWAPPLDVFDVAVRLETQGVTDRVAREDYRCADTLDLAGRCFPSLGTREGTGHAALPAPSAFGEYLKGVAFGLPLLLCSLAMFFFRFSLWGGDVSAEVAAAVGVGTISSFVVTGGFVQAMSRRSMFLLNAVEGRGVMAMCLRWLRWAALGLFASAAVLGVASQYFHLFPFQLLAILAGFHLALGLLWVAAGMLHALERTAMIVSACAIGLVAVVGSHVGAGMPVLPSQIAGILVAAGCSFLSVRRALSGYPLAGAPHEGSPSIDAYITWPYFAFGALYYLFLFVDRLLAWTVPDLSAPLSIVFRGDYETGLDISLVAFVLAAGAVRPGIVSFFHRVHSGLRTVRLSERAEFCARMRVAYRARLLAVVGFGCLISVAVGIGARSFGVSRNSHVMLILLGGLGSVPGLVTGLLNTNLLFRLSRPFDALIAIGPAVLLDLVTGYILTRIEGYPMAVVGLVAGSAVFAIVSSILAHRRLLQLDFENCGSAI